MRIASVFSCCTGSSLLHSKREEKVFPFRCGFMTGPILRFEAELGCSFVLMSLWS